MAVYMGRQKDNGKSGYFVSGDNEKLTNNNYSCIISNRQIHGSTMPSTVKFDELASYFLVCDILYSILFVLNLVVNPDKFAIWFETN